MNKLRNPGKKPESSPAKPFCSKAPELDFGCIESDPKYVRLLDMAKKNKLRTADNFLGPEMANFNENLPYVIRLLSNSEGCVRDEATIALGLAAKDGHDIQTAIPMIIRLLADPLMGIRVNAAEALKYAAERDFDISGAIPSLRHAMTESYDAFRENAIAAIACAAASKKNRESAIAAIREPIAENFMQFGALQALEKAADQPGFELDFSDLVPAIMHVFLHYPTEEFKKQAEFTLISLFVSGSSPRAVENAAAELLDFVNSDSGLGAGAESNSHSYSLLVFRLARVMGSAKEAVQRD